MEMLLIKVLNMSFGATYVALIVLVIRFLIKKLPKGYSYALWAIVLFRMLCPFTLESSFSLLRANPSPIAEGIGYEKVPQVDTAIAPIDALINGAIQESLPQAETYASINPMQIVLGIGEVVWIAGIVVLGIYALVSWVKLKRSLATTIKVGASIFEGEQVKAPFILGLIKPIIYLPLGLEGQTREYVLKHEQYHIKRKDYMVKIIFYVALIIHWFNPVMWISFYLMTKDMEMSCDEGVMRHGMIEDKQAYSYSLLALATKGHYFATPLAFGENHVKNRVKNIMSYRKPVFWVSIAFIIIGIGVMLGLLTNPKGQVSIPKMEIDLVEVYDSQNPVYKESKGGGESQVANWFYEIDENKRKELQEILEHAVWEEASDDVKYDFMPSMIMQAGVKDHYVICDNIEGKMYLEAFVAGEYTVCYFAPREVYQEILMFLEVSGVKKEYIDSYIEDYESVLKLEQEEEMIQQIEHNLQVMVEDDGLTSEAARNEDAYHNILKQGEPALEYLLQQFEGQNRNDKKGYIMMFLCQDLLEERDSVEEQGLQPNEWYSVLTIKEQTIIGDYVYDGDNPIEKLVYDHEVARTRSNEGFTVVAPDIKAIVEEENKVKVFFVTYSLGFVMYEKELFDKSGSIIPGALTYIVNNDGTYTLEKEEYAEDGSYHLSSIKAFCVSPVEGKVIEGVADELIYNNNEKIHELMKENLIKHLNKNGLKGMSWKEVSGEVSPLT